MRSTIMNGLPWRQGLRVAVAVLAAAVALTAFGSAASTRAGGAQASAHPGPSRSLGSGNVAITGKGIVDDSAAAAAQPSVDDAAYEACADTSSLPHHVGPEAASAQVAGWADAGKLGGSLPLGYPVAGMAQSQGGATDEGYYEDGKVLASDGADYVCAEALLHLDYDGQREFPPATATFLEYGSIPVTATAYLVQDGAAPLETVLYQQIYSSTGVIDEGSTDATIVTTSQVLLRVDQVQVNGVTLDVGGGCQTSGPVYTPDPVIDPDNNQLVLSGGNSPGEPEPREQSILAGGVQAGLATIPPFTSCVTPSGENLDALLDSSLSGPGNYVSVYQGELCARLDPAACNPSGLSESPPVYQPADAPYWTVSHGGLYSATAPLTITQVSPGSAPNTAITCPDAPVSGDIPDSTGPPRGPTGTFGWAGTLDCTDEAGNSWTITQQGTATLEVGFYEPATQTTGATIDNLTLDAQGPGGCTATLTGALPVTYTNGTASLTLLPNGPEVGTGGALLDEASSTCSQLQIRSPENSFTPDVSANYTLGSGMVITSP
jgi:hypothetical protein